MVVWFLFMARFSHNLSLKSCQTKAKIQKKCFLDTTVYIKQSGQENNNGAGAVIYDVFRFIGFKQAVLQQRAHFRLCLVQTFKFLAAVLC